MASAAIVILAIAVGLGENETGNRLALVAFTALVIATTLTWIETIWWRWEGGFVGGALRVDRNAWLVGVVVALGAAAVSQSWFHAGTVIAVGDVGPPNGTAWTSRVFDAVTWSGSNLGGPAALEQQLPFAGLLRLTGSIGSSPEMAQRVWFTLLFVGMIASATFLLTVLGLRAVPASVGAIAYGFSPFVVANAIPNPVYMAAMAMLPLLPGAVIAGANGLVRLRTALLILTASGPVLGYIDLNPPLLGMVAFAFLLSPASVFWLNGRTAARRSLLVLAVAIPLLLAISSYWIYPSAVQLLSVGAPTQLAGIASWSWTEVRANLFNGLWLNTAWGWAHPEYFPFASQYGTFPLAALRFAPAVLAFYALIRPHTTARSHREAYQLALVAMTSAIALGIVLISTGTNFPGSLVFDALYALPFGWLLREPGRFLIVADIMYAILIAVTVEGMITGATAIRHRILREITAYTTPAITVLLLLLAGFPIATGAIIADRRPTLPPMHVVIPSYWGDMAAYIDNVPIPGGVLIMPLDDYYQMPYVWGYDGNDQFIVDLMHRHVVNPTTGYFAASDQLENVVALTSRSLQARDWTLTDRLLRVLGTPLVLVRGDLDTTSPGRSFVAPVSLAASMATAPNLALVHRAGPLLLYELDGAPISAFATPPYVATVNTPLPDLRILSRLPPEAALIASPPIQGTPSILEVPPVSGWSASGAELSWSFLQRPGWAYDLISLDSETPAWSIDDVIAGHVSVGSIRVSRTSQSLEGSSVSIGLKGTQVLANGDFRAGTWGPVRDCNNVGGDAAVAHLNAFVVPSGGPSNAPYLQLSASEDTACESQHLTWQRGAVYLAMDVRNEAGNAPHICVWEIGPDRCATVPSITSEHSAWTQYSATLTPDPGSVGLDLFVYAASEHPGQVTRNDYSDIRVLQLPALPSLAILARPPRASHDVTLIVHRSSYGPGWRGPASSVHVRVDGLLNGWIADRPILSVATYTQEVPIRISLVISIAAALVAIGLLISLAGPDMYRHIRRVLSQSRTRRVGT